MAGEFTPTTEVIRAAFISKADTLEQVDRYAEIFDRWLRQVKAEAWDEGFMDRARRGSFSDSPRPNPAPPPRWLNPHRREVGSDDN